MSESKQKKIIVIGAGLAGLYSAFLLQKQGYDVCILEARDRVGGRTYTKEGIDLGGQWVSSLHERVMGLCEEFNIALYRQYDEGKFIRYFNGQRDELDEKHNVVAKEDNPLEKYIQQFSQLTSGNDLLLQFEQLDQVSFRDWCRQNVKEDIAHSTLIFSFWLLTCVDPSYGSMLFWLYFLRSCGGYRALAGIKGGAQEFRVEGGAQVLSNKLAAHLNIVFNAEVVRVEAQEEQYLLYTKDGQCYQAEKVISALPAQLIPGIDWQPALEPERLSFYQSLKMGSVTKVLLQYETDFWRQNGYNAQIISDKPPISLTYDACNSQYNAIVAFVTDDPGYTDEQITDHLSFLLNDQKAKSPLAIYKKNWAEDHFSGGCFFCVPAVGSLSQSVKYFTKPFKQVYFVGTETAGEWMGYMEGALESAERVVQQLNV